MVEIKKEGIILRKTNLSFENEGVLNPAVIKEDGKIHLFYRAVAKGNFSTVGHCVLSDPLTVEKRSDSPIIVPESEYEKHGVEDPRIVKIDDVFYLTYTSYDGINALGTLTTSNDLKYFKNKKIIVPKISYKEFKLLSESEGLIPDKYRRYNEFQINNPDSDPIFLWDKNLIFFPRKINDKFYFIHRIRPEIQIVSVKNIEDLNSDFWQDYFSHFKAHILLSPKYDHESSYIGGGCPPIETEYGWLMIYHGVYDTINGYVYNACAALLDLENPEKEISRLPYPLFKPEEEWELKGEVNNVCFPTGTIVENGRLYIYYGAADERIAVASLNISKLLKELMMYAV
ncbi:glycoside hydrolase family 130 protein [Chryseobacterium gwangjuense]|uniref:glycoside hydrolase family 130 protein n=1 Tax=Chryseobacterium gwangjuense TaxID=1069980 RepID=UPI001E29C562|nr:pesticidal protein Cry7Aa [Chryseobacterium gwangjuense]MCE3076225.1 pesticidal protein Cry7Aa [Chryseobacterium gwangjuense]